MRRGPGAGRVGRSRGPAAVALALALAAGCGGGDGDGAAPEVSTTPSSTTTTEAATTTTTEAATTVPEAVVKVPLDEELADRLPRLLDVDGFVIDDEAFDERLCDGSKAPTVPESQARATYEVSPTETIAIAAYRFDSGVVPYYASVYVESVRACAVEVGDDADLGLSGGGATAFELETERGEAFIATVVDDDVLWVLYQERTDGSPVVDPSTIGLFLDAADA